MFTPEGRDNSDIKHNEEELERLKKERELVNNPELDEEDKEAERILQDDNASKEDKNWAKRYRDTKSHYDKRVNELNKRIEELEAANKQPEVPASIEELNQLRERDPEVVTAVEAIAQQMMQEKMAPVQERLQTLEQTNNEQTVKLAQEQIRKKHPDFDKINYTTEFYDWVETKSDLYKNAVYGDNTDPNLVIDVLTLYKTDRGIVAKKEATPTTPKKTDAARMVADSKGATPSDGSGEKIKESDLLKITDPSEFKKIYAQHKAAGTILYGQ